MMQTLGYRKTIDNLTDKRLAQLTGIRIDHLRPALDSFLTHNLFCRIEHRDYDYQYRICDEFLDDRQSTIVYPPTLPKTGAARDSWEDFPEVGEYTKVRAYSPPTSVKSTELGGHTTENPYIKKPQQQKTPLLEKQQPQTKTKKTDFIKKQPQPKTEKTDFIEKQQQPFVTKISMTGLENMPKEITIESSGSVHFEFSAKTTQNTAQDAEKKAKPTSETIAESVTETHIEPITESTAKPIIQETIQDTTKPVVVVDKKEKMKKPLAIPNAVGEVNIKACNNHFRLLTEQQQKDVLLVFYHMLKIGKIRNKANYFISLIESAKKDSLTIPTEAIASQKSQTPEAIAKRKAAAKEREKRATHWSNYCWVKEQAISQNKSEESLAKSMGFEDAYALFGGQQACAA